MHLGATGRSRNGYGVGAECPLRAGGGPRKGQAVRDVAGCIGRASEVPHMALVIAIFIGQLLSWLTCCPKLHRNKRPPF